MAGLLFAGGCGRSRPPESAGADREAPPAAEAPWFEEVAAAAGVTFGHSSGHHGRFLMPEINTGGAGLLDFDNDGLLDVFLVNGGFADPTRPGPPGHRLYRNLGGWRFADVTAEARAGANAGYGMGVACADFDGDGWTDLYVLNLRANVLLRNRGDGTFEDVTARAGVSGEEWSSSAAFLDFDDDGHLDLFVVNYLHWSPATEIECYSRGGVPDYCSPLSYRAPAMDRLFRNRGDGTFEDVSRTAGLHRAFGNGLGVATGDFDRDGRVDVFVANDATPNQLWHNLGGGRFEDVAPLQGAALNSLGVPRAGMGVVAVDLLQRGRLDLFVTHLAGEGNGLFLNNGGRFTDVITPRGPMQGSLPFTGFGVAFRDFDHDGEADLFVANGRVRLGAQDLDPRDPYAEPNTLLRGLGGGEFAMLQPAGGAAQPLLAASRGAAFGDLDNDGAEDVVVVNKDGPVHLLRNVAPRRGRWVGLDVRDAHGRVARNAIVRLAAGGRTWWRQVQPNEGYASSNDPRLVFGLGTASSPVQAWVRWPDGAVEAFGPLTEGRYQPLVRAGGRTERGEEFWPAEATP